MSFQVLCIDCICLFSTISKDSKLTVLKKIFPEPHDGLYDGLNIDNEGLYSITHPKEAEIISQNIITIMHLMEYFQ